MLPIHNHLATVQFYAFTVRHSTPSTVTTLLQSMNVLCTHKDVCIYCKESTVHRVGICICLHLTASGCIWLHLGASGCIWVHLGASGCIWVHLGAFGWFWCNLIVKKCMFLLADSLVWHDVRMYVRMYTCNHQQPTTIKVYTKTYASHCPIPRSCQTEKEITW